MQNPSPAPRVVLDTNVVLDWLVFRDPAVAALGAALRAARVCWLASPRMHDELAAVLARGHLARWQTEPSEQVLALFREHASACAEPPPSHLLCTDPDDQMFVDLALAEHSDWLLTRDRALLRLARRARPRGLRIATPAAWTAADAAGVPMG